MSLLERLEIRVPVVQAPMAGVSTPAMAAAVSNAGGLGSIALGAFNADRARQEIVATQRLTNRAFNVNVFCHAPAVPNAEKEAAWIQRLFEHFKQFHSEPPATLREIYKSFVADEELLAVLIELRPRVVSFHFGLPHQPTIDRLKSAGILILATATNLDEAQRIERSGADAVVAQGFEAGGHRGVFEPDKQDEQLGVRPLVSLLAGHLNIPIIAAGGIMDGADISDMLKLGAQATQLGTAFIACPESLADDFFRTALLSDAANHTTMTRAISGRPARCLANRFTELGRECDPNSIPDYPIAYDAGKALNAAAKACGEGGYGAQWAGAGAPRVRTGIPAADLVLRLEVELLQAMASSRIT